MDDQIIDLSGHLDDSGTEETFAIHGGEGEHARLALPVWRAVYLLEGERAGIVWHEVGTRDLRALFVLDLGADPPRTDFGARTVEELRSRQPPSLEMSEGAAVVLLGRTPERSWYLVIVGEKVGKETVTDARTREDLLFLAGECAGMLLREEGGRA